MRPIFPHTKNPSATEDYAYTYLLGPDGCYLRKQNPLCRAIVKIDPNTEFNLVEIKEELTLNENITIPARWVYRAVEFFRTVYRAHQTEALLLIRLDPENAEITLACPHQINGAAHVHADVDPTLTDDLLTIGTIHSHPCASFHSTGDIEDERRSDGLHIVIGHLDRPIPDFTASLVVKGVRQELDPAAVMELAFGFDETWLTKIHPVRPRKWRRILGRTP